MAGIGEGRRLIGGRNEVQKSKKVSASEPAAYAVEESAIGGSSLATAVIPVYFAYADAAREWASTCRSHERMVRGSAGGALARTVSPGLGSHAVGATPVPHSEPACF